MRSLFSILALVFISGCGAQQQLVTAALEKTEIVFLGPQLVGATLSIDDTFKSTVRREDLIAYKMGVLGVTDRDDERFERVAVTVDPGTHRVRVDFEGKVLFDENLYVGRGQVREVRIK